MFLSSSRVPLSALAAWCRALHHGIGSGLSPVKVFRMQAKSGPAAVRGIASDIAERMAKGDSLADALEPYRNSFPPLFVELAAVGEESGCLEDVFDELAQYYETAWRTRQEFLRMMMYPALQFGAAVLVITLLIFVLGIISEGRGKPGVDVLGLGLTGESGAITFLTVMGGLAAIVFFGFRFAMGNVTYRAKLEGLALWLPAWGAALLPFALQRFCLALRISHEAGLPADRCLRYAFRATSNAAFMAHEDRVAGKVRKGQEIGPVLERSGAPFPEDFLASLSLAETTGQITEVMDRLAEGYREDAMRKLKTATQFTGYAVYGLVAILIIIAIFRIATIYINMLGGAGI